MPHKGSHPCDAAKIRVGQDPQIGGQRIDGRSPATQGGGVRYRDRTSFQALLDDHQHRWIERLHNLDHESPIAFTGWDDWDETGVLKPEHPAYWRL